MDSQQRIRHRIPQRLKWLIKQGIHLLGDIFDQVAGRRPCYLPPRWLRFVGDGDNVQIGKEHFDVFNRWGDLQPNESVLEVGCGTGLMAIPFTSFLTSTYDGFDVVPQGVKWCRSHISRRFENFSFQHADIVNSTCNPAGKIDRIQLRISLFW